MDSTIVVAIKERLAAVTAEMRQLEAMLRAIDHPGAITRGRALPPTAADTPSPVHYRSRTRRRPSPLPRGTIMRSAYTAAMNLQAHGHWTPAQLRAHMDGVGARWSGVSSSIIELMRRGIVRKLRKGQYETVSHPATALPPSVASYLAPMNTNT